MYQCPDCGVYFDAPDYIQDVVGDCINTDTPVYTRVSCPGDGCNFALGYGGEPDWDEIEDTACVMIFGFDLTKPGLKLEACAEGVRLNADGSHFKD